MPKSRMANVEVRLEDDESEEEIKFVFLPFGLQEFQEFLNSDLGLEIKGDEEEVAVAEDELRDAPLESVAKASRRIFSKCISHKIVDRSEGVVVNEATLEKIENIGDAKSMKLVEEALDDDPYALTDFTIDEQTQIFEEVLEDAVGNIEEGKKKAEKFRGD